ncbi:MAG: acyl-CoA dehydrogenase family protein [Anaerolineales bacterium]|nr:acyl-CoA dehydrogenase family protein [Anaerolineales bacterium]
MYSFTPTEEQQMLIDAVGRYAENDLRPAAREADEEAQLSRKLIEKGWELGVLQASLPGEYGGFGDYSAVTGVLAAEAMAYGDLSSTLAVMTPNLFVLPLLFSGTEEQKKNFIPDVIAAEWKPYSAALLEPDFNFDPHQLSTTAERVNDHFLLTGEKTMVPFAADAEAFVVYAKWEDKTQGFIVPADSEGLTAGENQRLLGVHALPLYNLTLDEVKITADRLLGGDDGHDFKPHLASSWIALSAMAVGVADAAFDYSRDYAKDREVFGVKVAQKQAIAFMLAEMATEIEAVRLLTWEAAWMIDERKEKAYQQAYLAINAAVDMVMTVTDCAVQILAGHGYIREHPVEMWMRNGRGFANFTGLAMV